MYSLFGFVRVLVCAVLQTHYYIMVTPLYYIEASFTLQKHHLYIIYRRALLLLHRQFADGFLAAGIGASLYVHAFVHDSDFLSLWREVAFAHESVVGGGVDVADCCRRDEAEPCHTSMVDGHCASEFQRVTTCWQ